MCRMRKMVCAGDPAICQTSGDAVDFSAHQPRPHDDIFQHRTGAGSEELKDSIEGFQLLVGASPKQRMKCGAVAYDGNYACRLRARWQRTGFRSFFFHFLEEKGIRVERESNGITDTKHDKGRYPVIARIESACAVRCGDLCVIGARIASGGAYESGDLSSDSV